MDTENTKKSDNFETKAVSRRNFLTRSALGGGAVIALSSIPFSNVLAQSSECATAGDVAVLKFLAAK